MAKLSALGMEPLESMVDKTFLFNSHFSSMVLIDIFFDFAIVLMRSAVSVLMYIIPPQKIQQKFEKSIDNPTNVGYTINVVKINTV